MNVVTIGWANSDIFLAAQISLFPFLYVSNPAPGDDRPRVWYYDPDGEQLATFWGYLSGTSSHFPYGVSVTPDVPGPPIPP